MNRVRRSGQPCIRDTRITYKDVLEYLAGGMTEDEILAEFPDLRPEDFDRGIIARAIEVMGDKDKALRWFNTPVPALGYKIPASLLGTLEGIAQIEETLGALEHGIW